MNNCVLEDFNNDKHFLYQSECVSDVCTYLFLQICNLGYFYGVDWLFHLKAKIYRNEKE